MKKLTYLALAAAFTFGFQSNQAFSNTGHQVAAEEMATTQVQVQFIQESQKLNIRIVKNLQKEKVLVQVANSEKGMVAKEVFYVAQQGGEITMDLNHLPGGKYHVKIVGESFKEGYSFSKK